MSLSILHAPSKSADIPCAAFAPVLLARKAKKIRVQLDAESGGNIKEVRTIYQKTAKRE